MNGELERETLRLNRRYVVEIVEAFGLCPWADRARREGHVTEIVFDQTSPDLFEPSLRKMAELADQKHIDVALFIYPRIALKRLDFEHFARQLRTLDADRHPPSLIPFAIAAFHPDALPILTNPDRLVPFLRRTPDPTLQLVRVATLDRVRGATHGTSFFGADTLAELPVRPPESDIRDRIAKTNFDTVVRVGVEAMDAIFSDILCDREQTHARLVRTEGAPVG